MGSDCAYFEGPDNHSQDEYNEEDYGEEELKQDNSTFQFEVEKKDEGP